MKKSLILSALVLATLTLSSPAEAAQQFQTYESAQKVGSKEGYIVFIYPADWDRYGEKLCRKLIADEGVRKAARKSALLLAPIYQNRTKESNDKASKILGKLGIPGDMADISYPAIAFYEPVGRMYATIHGEALMKADTAKVARLIQEKMEAKDQQDELLKQAHASKDAGEKNRLFLASSRVSGLEWPGGLRNAMNQADPKDENGYISALNFGFGVKNGESMEDFLKRLDAVLANDRLSAWQKQRACAVAIGHIRRSLGTMAGGPYITKYGRAMHELDPKSSLGLAGPVVMRDWVRTYRYGHGWSPEVLPGCEVPLLMHDVPVDKAGTYTVTFKIVTGRDALLVNKIRLMDGERCVAEDTTARAVTWGATTQVFTLNVKKAVKNAALEITFGNAPDKRSTWGNITVNRQ